MTITNKPKSWRDVLPIHPAAEMFEVLPPHEQKALGEDIRKHGLQQPIIILSTSDGDLLLDGRNRLDAMERVGIQFEFSQRKNGRWKLEIFQEDDEEDDVPYTLIDLVRTVYDSEDPYAFVLSANLHRRHLTAEDKRDVIAKWLKATPEKSNRQIAEAVKVDHKTVASVRAEKQATGEIPQLTETIGKDGKARRTQTGAAQKPPTPPATPPKATTDSACVRSTPDQPPPATLIASEHDAIIAEYTMCLMGMIDEAAHRLDPSECVTLLERLLSIINGLLVGAKQAAKNMREEPPKAVSPAVTKPKPPQPDDGLPIPAFLRRQPS